MKCFTVGSMSLMLYENVRDKPSIRESFFSFLKETCAVDMRGLFFDGYWMDSYTPFCLVDHGRVIANVSTYYMDACVQGERHSYIQICNVAVDKAYRNRGIARTLMEHVLSCHHNNADLIYLLAHEGVMNYYPQFGLYSRKRLRIQVNTPGSNT